MRQNQNAKRSRGRGRRPNNSGQNSFNRNTTFESNGPEGRLRGNAQQLFEKYTSLANDAQSSGERVLFEANSQFADHYYRIQQSILANAEQRRQNDERSAALIRAKKHITRQKAKQKLMRYVTKLMRRPLKRWLQKRLRSKKSQSKRLVHQMIARLLPKE